MIRAMRQMKSYVLLSAICSLLAVVGCSVKENRSECPCRLNLDLSNVCMEPSDSLLLMIDSQTEYTYSSILGKDSLRGDYVVDVPRISLRLMAWCGGEGMVSRDGLIIPIGRSCPKIYNYVADIDADAESVHDTLVMRKNHCVVDIDFKYGSGDDLTLTVLGNVCGYDVVGTPLMGEFLATAISLEDDKDALRQIVLPRQRGGELTLKVDGTEGLIKSFPLSDYIAATGYDWTSPDLNDILLTIDVVHTTVSLSVSGWDEEFFFDVVI